MLPHPTSNTQKPAEQQIEIYPFSQLSLCTYYVKNLLCLELQQLHLRYLETINFIYIYILMRVHLLEIRY